MPAVGWPVATHQQSMGAVPRFAVTVSHDSGQSRIEACGELDLMSAIELDAALTAAETNTLAPKPAETLSFAPTIETHLGHGRSCTKAVGYIAEEPLIR